MIQMKELKLMNESMILYLKKIGMDSKRNEIIRQILNDDACFFRMDSSDAYAILHDIGVASEKLETIYSSLVSRDEFYRLQKEGKIKENEKDLKIKYENYDTNNLFKK